MPEFTNDKKLCVWKYIIPIARSEEIRKHVNFGVIHGSNTVPPTQHRNTPNSLRLVTVGGALLAAPVTAQKLKEFIDEVSGDPDFQKRESTFHVTA